MLAYRRTYGAPVVITRSSNNYGPYQYPEKIVPLFVTNALDGQPLPVYGDGRNVRDWIYVDDNCRALDLVLRDGRDGEIYNVGGGNEVANLDLTRGILAELGLGDELVRYVADRPGHDRRYALDCAKLRDLGWEPRVPFADGPRAHRGLVRRPPRLVGEDQVGRVAPLLRTPVPRAVVASSSPAAATVSTRKVDTRPAPSRASTVTVLGPGPGDETPAEADGAVGRGARVARPGTPGACRRCSGATRPRRSPDRPR